MRGNTTNARAVLMTLLLVLPASIVRSADDPVRDIDALTLQWTGLEHQVDVLQTGWQTQKPVLEQQLSLLEHEADELNDVLETSARKRDEVEQKRLELLEQQTRFEQEQAALGKSLVQASAKLHALEPQLPPPLLEGWAKDLRRLDDPGQTASDKLQLVVELLGQLNDFERKVTVHETVMTLADGEQHVVKQVYLGLSHGWYVTADQRFAAAGTAAADGWQWTPVSDAGPIAEIVAILERRRDPDLVSIPLKLGTSGPAK